MTGRAALTALRWLSHLAVLCVLCVLWASCRPAEEDEDLGPDAIPAPRGADDGVTLLDAVDTLRKASLQLAGRIPTQAERDAVQAGGLAALDPILLQMMTEEAFYDRVKEIFNDVLLTDAYLFETMYDSVISKGVNPKTFPNRAWYGSPDTDDGRLTVNAVAREPLELVANVVRKDRPLTEIVTARYRMVNPSSARVFGVSPSFKDPKNLAEFVETAIPAMHEYAPGMSEYAGVLTTPAFLLRYPNTETNRNRKRSRYFYKFFLNYDIMKTATRLDLSSVNFSDQPWLRNPACTACHATIDPVAGSFQNWSVCYSGEWIQYNRPQDRHCDGAWYPPTSMFQPGTGTGADHLVPAAALPRALEVLAGSVVGNLDFAKAMVSHVLSGLTGRKLLNPPDDPSLPGYANLSQAYETQQQAVADLAARFAQDNFNLKRLVLAIVKSPQFRTDNADRGNRLELSGLGGGTLTPPEVLHRRIASVLGAPWGTAGSVKDRSTVSSPYYLLALSKLRMFYGGIDSRDVTARQTLPSGLSGAASQRMAYEMSCEYVALDFAAPRDRRRLFPFVERGLVPSGDPGAPDQAGVLRNLQHLHERILGERLELDSAELLESYRLLTALRDEGVRAMAAGLSPRLGDRCQGVKNYATGEAVTGGTADDAAYVVRAWQGLVAYLLMDYRFLFE